MALTTHEFRFVSELVKREAGIVLAPGKEYLVEARLLPLARKFGVTTVSELISQAQRQGASQIRWGVIEALTTNETSWYRDREPYMAMSTDVVPDLLRARSGTRSLRVWSAACSSGQEPYSLAIVLEETLPSGWNYEILASDISVEMLDRARAGRFSQLEMNRGLPAAKLVHHFERSGTHWQVSAALRRKVNFRQINLTVPLPSMPHFDIIFLRNVLIYFDVETKQRILRQMRSLLRPDGWLFLGSAETTIGIDGEFERTSVGRTSAYRPRAGSQALTSTAQKGAR